MNEWYPKEVLGKSIVLRFPMNIFVKMFSFNVLKHKFKMLKENMGKIPAIRGDGWSGGGVYGGRGGGGGAGDLMSSHVYSQPVLLTTCFLLHV